MAQSQFDFEAYSLWQQPTVLLEHLDNCSSSDSLEQRVEYRQQQGLNFPKKKLLWLELLANIIELQGQQQWQLLLQIGKQRISSMLLAFVFGSDRGPNRVRHRSCPFQILSL
jgi:hypothetical protein